jgi:hypothetical protein
MNAMARMDWFTVAMQDIEIPCERPARNADAVARGLSPSPDCGGSNPAEWIRWFRCGCAPPYALYCTYCKDVVLQTWLMLNCGGCGLYARGSDMYSLIEPLNKAA